MIKRMLALLVCMVAAQNVVSGQCEIAPLNILLTNDDGYNTPAIRTLHRALADAGHRVKRIAPARNYSGSSASLTLTKVSAPQTPDGGFDEVYAVTGTPATTVLLGATALFEPGELDLVISGINEGANLGPGTVMSGTVGATTAATQALAPSIPAIAISTNLLDKQTDSLRNKALYKQVSSFIVNTVAQLQVTRCKTGDALLPEKTALNINYPPLDVSEIKGVVVTRQGRTPYFSIGFTALENDDFAPSINMQESNGEDKRADTDLFAAGFITIVPIDGDMTAKPTRALRQLKNLRP